MNNDLIAFQGSFGAHSDMAARRAYPYMKTLPCPFFEDVFEAVESGKAALGLIPVENSRAGRVAEIHNLLPNTSLYIVGEYIHDVAHHLLGVGELAQVKQAYSHTQALMQCREHLREFGIAPEGFSDTAAAAQAVKEWNDPSKAAIASDLAADLYGLKILAPNIQDANNNRTFFVSLAKEPVDVEPKGHVLTSIIFTTRNIPAGLYKALGGFASNQVNVLKLESYILDYASGTAQFFMTFEGHPDQKHVKLALEELGFFTQKFRLLGVYAADKRRFA